MRFLSLLLAVSPVSAFVTRSHHGRSSSSSSSKADATPTTLRAIAPEKENGVLPPLGFFDPLKLCKRGPYGDEVANFRHYRSLEVKHGRIAMAATLGMLVQENYRFAGYISPSADLKFSDIPNGLAALDVVPLLGLVQIAVVIGIHEFAVREKTESDAPGDFGTGYLGVKLDSQSAKQLRLLNVEISNGRLAMLGILGMFASENVHGEPLFETHFFG